ncbi:acid sphingomyelinase-like phosphodiesterase 3b [Macrosteles quadrilineatus]|uniref:acid sphingomyelinase-like phosphodiesterase 3b n=1 Tax=Macrosteles quadrilineatus TaxID=74068 RepID=UPI0023E32276|nr:acid sphingomyelinase-like phosphodiesterase 3b [Macrosteles quadrilineatus]XP_054258450.1 acid sphingomyelinase-like phosphodiesterase 3b [Macrosteles quadrilineatus]XP_054258451.1 acid sphingomyelinase-like phosphodiesterase 3b [Macrosteles quadrilineatus]
MLWKIVLLTYFLSQVSPAKIGYFWHITDIHLDTHYHSYKDNNCWRGGTSRLTLGKYGDYNCDSPWPLIESAVLAMKAKHGENIEFVLWTGDALSNPSRQHLADNFAAVRNLTHLLSHAFSSSFVFPVLGHNDPKSAAAETQPYRHLSSMWRNWLPPEVLHTFNKGGFYSIEQKSRRLRLVALNTNLWTGEEGGEDPGGQWQWLETLMAKSYRLKETIYLVGHMAPGTDERLGSPSRTSMAPRHNSRYLRLVRRYADIITGQFFGHLHSDTFRVVYNEAGRPVSNIFIAPSVTPKRSSSGFNNPAIRLYKFNSDTGQVIDYVQYYLDLTTANQRESADWTVEYNLTSYYGFHRGVSAGEFHDLAESFTVTDGLPLFARYYLVNSVSTSGVMASMQQAHNHYCAITRLDPGQFYNCLASAPSALFSSASSLDISLALILSSILILKLR